MKTYAVKYAKSALKELKKIDRKQQVKIIRVIQKLGENPRAGNVRPMVGVSSWRLRVGDYRVIYDILDRELVVQIIRVCHRRGVYRK